MIHRSKSDHSLNETGLFLIMIDGKCTVWSKMSELMFIAKHNKYMLPILQFSKPKYLDNVSKKLEFFSNSN